ncbi:glycosyltransferase family 2 protein [Micromonospora auratinigra]|uniref:Glycosyltransferase involved in cell wall bisynthesis n=1 Tax=Micromonospora auratinigra TaxID=261654 RepID=A0A1A8Z177_9ACTN|nr:glycosyltransferase [Micromonospora auratinigra]SBT37561.1 Glycosyltransferase involved in cell wall bisynthesis [Micromonospora auratinigra]
MVTETRHPLLSVVVPVHGVQAHLHQCLDSILDGLDAADAADVELIAVDDASPDRCGELLRAYAARRPAVRTVTLPSNVGLGLARNAGLDEATGRYVWFVDSDDWLPPGSLAAVLRRLRADEPDVLLLDHLRVHHDGRLETDASSPLLRGVDGCVRLADRPQLLRVQHTAWNKVVRRPFLTELGLRFHPGWYEDIPFSHPLLIAAERIAVLDQVCYRYRQGRPGAITSTRSDRHLDAFDQYDRLFGWLAAARPGDARLHAELFALMVSHLLVVVGNDHRMPPELRRAFFRRVAGHYRRYRPAGGYPRPGGVGGLKHRLVAANSYPAYAALRAAHRIAGRLRPAHPVVVEPVSAGPAAVPAAAPGVLAGRR